MRTPLRVCLWVRSCVTGYHRKTHITIIIFTPHKICSAVALIKCVTHITHMKILRRLIISSIYKRLGEYSKVGNRYSINNFISHHIQAQSDVWACSSDRLPLHLRRCLYNTMAANECKYIHSYYYYIMGLESFCKFERYLALVDITRPRPRINNKHCACWNEI